MLQNENGSNFSRAKLAYTFQRCLLRTYGVGERAFEGWFLMKNENGLYRGACVKYRTSAAEGSLNSRSWNGGKTPELRENPGKAVTEKIATYCWLTKDVVHIGRHIPRGFSDTSLVLGEKERERVKNRILLFRKLRIFETKKLIVSLKSPHYYPSSIQYFISSVCD